jgi:hypothetical protein
MRTFLAAILLASCHPSDYNNGKVHPDGGGSGNDGGANIFDAPPQNGLVTVVLLPGATPTTGLVSEKLIFHSPDGATAEDVPPDASGTTTHAIMRGGMVTLAVHSNPCVTSVCDRYDLYTVRSVNPGDTITIGGQAPAPPTQSVPTTVTFPGAAALDSDAGVATYYADVGSGQLNDGNDPAVPLSATASYLGADGKVHALGWATDASGVFRASASGSGDVVSGSAVVTLGAWTTTTGLSVAFTDPPPGANYLYMNSTASSMGVPFSLPYFSTTPGSGPMTYDVPLDASALDGMDASMQVSIPNGNGQDYLTWEKRGPLAASTSVDLQKALLGRVLFSSPEVETNGQLGLRWAVTSGGAPADAALAYLSWYDPTTGTSANWTTIMPADTAVPVLMPTLPSDLEPGFTPSKDPTVYQNPATFDLIDTDFTSGYDQFKAAIGTDAFFTHPGTILTSYYQYST